MTFLFQSNNVNEIPQCRKIFFGLEKAFVLTENIKKSLSEKVAQGQKTDSFELIKSFLVSALWNKTQLF